jgi:hypothetical protein
VKITSLKALLRATSALKIIVTVLVLTVSLFSQERKGTISGFVKDGQSGEVIPFAEVYLKDENLGTLTDRNGYYVLASIPPGEHTVAVSIVGYRPLEKIVLVRPGESVRFDARMRFEAIPVKGITVTAERERFKKEVDVGVRQLKLRDMKIAPGFIEQDLFKSLQMLPGIVAISDFSSALYVRGGSPDQNLVLLDGVNVYSPYHLGGLFSTFNLDALKNADFHASAFPAEYGGAVSSVLDVEMKQGNSERFEGDWDVSLLSSKVVLEGPIPKGSFLIAARRTYLDAFTWVIDKALRGNGIYYFPYYFYDIQSKVNFDLSEKNRLTLSGFFGDDIISLGSGGQNLDFRWGNYTLGLKWRYLFTPKIFSTLLVTTSRYRVGLSDVPSDSAAGGFGAQLKLGIGDVDVKEDITYFPNPNHTLKIGAEGKFLDIYNFLKLDTLIFINSGEKPDYAALYLSDKWQATPKFLVNLGARGEYFTGGRYIRISPRVGAKYFLKPDLALKAGYGHYYQFLSIPFPRDEMMMKFPVFMFQQWLPANERFKPVSAVHYTVGAEKWVSADVNLSVEGYFKSMSNLLETNSPFSWLEGNNPGIDSLIFNVGTGWASGVELLLKRKDSWIGYSFAVTKRTFDSVSFYPIFDARHNFNIAWAIPLGRTWNLSLQWIYRTGFPYTGPIGRYQYVTTGPDGEREYQWILINGRRGEFRYPAYHHLDIGIDKQFKLFGLKFTGYFQVVNVYARKNVLWYDYDFSTEPPQRKPQNILPGIPIPSFGIRGSF